MFNFISRKVFTSLLSCLLLVCLLLISLVGQSQPTASVTVQSTCFIATGTITVTLPIPAAGVTYTVTGTLPVVAGVTNATGIFAGLAAGDYDVTSTVGAVTSLPTALTVNPQPVTPAAPTGAVFIQPDCATPTGIIAVLTPPVGAGITYTVTGTAPVVAGVTNAVGFFPGLNPGNYNVTTTNGAGCTSTAIALTVNAAPATPAAPTASVSTQPTCAIPTGTITVTLPANGAGITYSISGTASATNATGIFAGLASGNYNVTTTNGAGCTSTATALTVNICSLPVELLSFKGENQDDNTNLISWETLSEINNDYFTLERGVQNEEQITWEEIGELDGAGNSNVLLTYRFVDKSPNYNTVSYYRLNQTDFDGSSKYSKIIALQPSEIHGFEISNLYPNPTENQFSFTLLGKANNLETLAVSIYNSVGENVKRAVFSDVSDQANFKVSVADLNNGVYFVNIKIGDKKLVEKLAILR